MQPLTAFIEVSGFLLELQIDQNAGFAHLSSQQERHWFAA
ncbi:MAG TPA: hypothetical protein ENN24_05495 [Bacteroidetes bacterium]|nr:hypothetical protein [Bacteroidota bacterium]